MTSITERTGGKARGSSPRPAWSNLPRRAQAWRLVHGAWSIAQLAGLFYIWECAISGRRTAKLWTAVGFLSVEGGALIAGGGDCPVAVYQAKWGDPVPFFELVLPPRAAKAAVPVLMIVSLAGITAVVVRRPGLVVRAA